MAVNDFWNRVAGDLGSAEGASEFRIGVELLGAVLGDVAIQIAGITVAQARAMMKLIPGSDADNELTDLLSSAATINNASPSQQRLLRGVLVDGIRYAAAISEQTTGLPMNPYGTGESVRLRAKALIAGLGGTPQGSLAV